MKIKGHFFTVLLLLVLNLGIFTFPAQANLLPAPTAYDVINTVNALRASNGLPPLRTNSALMAAAQAQSDYQASIGTWSHSGPDGKNPTQRDMAAGYGGGAAIFTSENVAELSSGLPVDNLINSYWADSIHMATMLSTSATDMGAGVTESDGYDYYTLDVSYIASHPAKIVTPFPTPTPHATMTPDPTATQNVLATADETASLDQNPTSISVVTSQATTQAVYPTSISNVNSSTQTETPQADGNIVHVAQPGESFYSIAVAYGVTIAEIKVLNNIPSGNNVVFVGQKLLIKTVSTATPFPSPTDTEVPPTPTQTMTFIPETATSTLTSTPEISLTVGLPLTGATQSPVDPAGASFQAGTIGIILVVGGLAALAIAIAVYFLSRNRA